MASSSFHRRRKKWWLVGGILLGAMIAVVAANFVRSEKKVEHAIESPYDVADPQFTRSMGSLLGTALLAGNGVTELLNGDAIVPPMLAAIRRADDAHVGER